jgi:alkanesulfonate monooxygenase SsuD/methylene tetrahydromethanopterin reductase-like flavin-dependent oxidoreductase (luciferase family)
MPQAKTARERVGFNVRRGRAGRAIELIRQAEAAGVATVWMTQSAVGADTPTTYAAAAVQTERVKLGTGIVPAFTRHPLALAGQALVIDDLAPGRLRLGIGTSHGPNFARPYGFTLDRPLDRLREYLQVLRGMLHEGRAQLNGEFYQVDARWSATPKTEILVSALRENAWELAGELSDGGISWLTPIDFLLTVAKPAMQRGAERAGRETPPLIAHVSVAFGTDRDAIRTNTRQQLGYYTRLPFYTSMFAAAGYPLGPGGEYSDDLLDHLVIAGNDDTLAEQLRGLLGRGLDELLVMLIHGEDQASEEQRLLRIIGGL